MPEKGFSKEEVEEINIDLGINPEENQTATVMLNADSETDNPPHDEGQQVPADASEEGSGGGEVISLAAREKAAKDLFYEGMCGGFDISNGMLSKDHPEGPYRSLDLEALGEDGRAASDQCFDRLCDIPMFKRWLFKLRENVIMEKWGAILMLAYIMFKGFKKEKDVRTEAAKERAALKEPTLKETPKKPLKEKTAKEAA